MAKNPLTKNEVIDQLHKREILNPQAANALEILGRELTLEEQFDVARSELELAVNLLRTAEAAQEKGGDKAPTDKQIATLEKAADDANQVYEEVLTAAVTGIMARDAAKKPADKAADKVTGLLDTISSGLGFITGPMGKLFGMMPGVNLLPTFSLFGKKENDADKAKNNEQFVKPWMVTVAVAGIAAYFIATNRGQFSKVMPSYAERVTGDISRTFSNATNTVTSTLSNAASAVSNAFSGLIGRG